MVGSPWYGPSWEKAQISRRRMRIPWPRGPMIPELTRHHGEKPGPPPSHPSIRRDAPPHHGQETPTWEQAAQTGHKVTRSPLRGILVGIQCLRTLPTGSPHLEVKERPRVGKTGMAKSPQPPPPHSISPSPEGADPVGTSVPCFLTAQIIAQQSLSLSSLFKKI
jgi:hypothetical protein